MFCLGYVHKTTPELFPVSFGFIWGFYCLKQKLFCGLLGFAEVLLIGCSGCGRCLLFSVNQNVGDGAAGRDSGAGAFCLGSSADLPQGAYQHEAAAVAVAGGEGDQMIALLIGGLGLESGLAQSGL